MSPSALTFRPDVLAAREWLAVERQKLRQQHDAGSPGIQVCARLTELFDQVLLRLYESALADMPEQAAEFRDEVALVALGGYGRGDVAPYSDVDLLILHSRAATHVSLLAKRLLHDLYDVGLELGQSARTPRDVILRGVQRPHFFHRAGRSAVHRRQRNGVRQIRPEFSPRRQSPLAQHGDGHRAGPPARAIAIWRNRVPLGAERQAIPRRFARSAIDPLGRLRALRPIRSRRPGADGRDPQRRSADSAPCDGVLAAQSATNCIFTPARRKTR